METARPEIQLISNIVVKDGEGHVLFVKYDPEDDRWWLPGDDLSPYQHPDDRAREILNGIAGLEWDDLALVFIESFRGRRGWHVMFNYSATGWGSCTGDIAPTWLPTEPFPRTMHG